MTLSNWWKLDNAQSPKPANSCLDAMVKPGFDFFFGGGEGWGRWDLYLTHSIYIYRKQKANHVNTR